MSAEATAKQRLISIDVLKALAVVLILNHRMHLSYGEWSMFATGGALGCGLFFFISGYCLAKASESTFKDWMLRRMSRLLPPVLIIAFINNYGYLQMGTYWFLQFIVAYYLIYYFIKTYALKYLRHIIAVCSIIFVVYFVSDGYMLGNMYGDSVGRPFLFFLFFLCGVAFRLRSYHPSCRTMVITSILSPIILVGEMVFRGHLLPFQFPEQLLCLSPLLLLTGIIGLLIATDYLNLLNSDSWFRRYAAPLIASIGALSLESYIGIGCVSIGIQATFAPLFPFNIPLVIGSLLLFCYFLRVCTRLAVVIITGRTQDFTLRHILKPY